MCSSSTVKILFVSIYVANCNEPTKISTWHQEYLLTVDVSLGPLYNVYTHSNSVEISSPAFRQIALMH